MIIFPMGFEWIRYESDAPFPEKVKKIPHVTFEVENLAEAIKGKKVIMPPNSPSQGVQISFIEECGAPVEFIQIDKSVAQLFEQP